MYNNRVTGGESLFFLTVIAYGALFLAFIPIVIAVKGRPKYYWYSALGFYIFSFLAGFSIGQITVGLTFIPLSLAIGYSIGWIKKKLHIIFFLLLGVLIGITMVLFVEDRWLFFPLIPFFG
jgi:hypothetical protein